MPLSRHAEARLDAELLRHHPLPDDTEGDKRTCGTVLVIGGGERTPGAALLAGMAALRVGAGRLQIAAAPAVTVPLAVTVPEALVLPYDDPSLHERVAGADAVAVGPGLDDHDVARELLRTVLDRAAGDAVVVVDASAITALADGGAPSLAGRQVILTPNREELDGLCRGDPAETAAALGATVICFGEVAAPDGRAWRDDVAVRGLGTSGAGDVLAGAAAGLGARCHDAVTAACWAALVHRMAATRLAKSVGPVGYLARQLADELPTALSELS